MDSILVCICIICIIHAVHSQFISEFWSAPRPPINIYMDDYPPFYHGVTSGDPLPDSIILWTRATPRTPQEIASGISLVWKIWDRNSSEFDPVLSGNATALPERDWTVKVDAKPLPKPNTTYFFRFYTENETESSRLGRTRTAPDPLAEGGILTFAITSCSQHQMYQNTYAHLAFNMTIGGEVDPSLRGWTDENLEESEAINALLDLGDYIYDNNEKTTYARTWTGTCEDEKSRDPEDRETLLDPAFQPFMTSRQNCSWPQHSEEEWKFRHSQNHMDPDQRAALAAHPWIHLVDSHDVGNSPTVLTSNAGLRVFEWWTPVRWEVFNDSVTGEEKFRLHRVFRFGKLADVVVLDTRAVGLGNGENTYLGEDQRNFVRTEVLGPTTATNGWRIIMTGKAFVPWTVDLTIVTAVFLTLIFSVSACTVCCFVVHRRQQASVVVLGQTEVKHVVALGQDEQSIEVNPPDVIQKETIQFEPGCCCRCCGSKYSLYFGLFSLVALISCYIGAQSFIQGIKRLEIQEETGAVNPFATQRNWDGIGVIDRAEFLKDIVDSGFYADNVFVSGDMHMLTACDVMQSTKGTKLININTSLALTRNLPDYNNITVDRVGVEWLPSSTSSRNIDDFMYASIPFPWLIDTAATIVRNVIQNSNPEMRFFDTIQHGIGYMHLTEDEAHMEFYRNDVFFPFRQATKSWSGRVKRGANTWSDITRH